MKHFVNGQQQQYLMTNDARVLAADVRKRLYVHFGSNTINHTPI
jgi:hypothetical protein